VYLNYLDPRYSVPASRRVAEPRTVRSCGRLRRLYYDGERNDKAKPTTRIQIAESLRGKDSRTLRRTAGPRIIHHRTSSAGDSEGSSWERGEIEAGPNARWLHLSRGSRALSVRRGDNRGPLIVPSFLPSRPNYRV